MSSGSKSPDNNLDAIARARRLEELGIEIRSVELTQTAHEMNEFYERGGNRAMRRAAAKRSKRAS